MIHILYTAMHTVGELQRSTTVALETELRMTLREREAKATSRSLLTDLRPMEHKRKSVRAGAVQIHGGLLRGARTRPTALSRPILKANRQTVVPVQLALLVAVNSW